MTIEVQDPFVYVASAVVNQAVPFTFTIQTQDDVEVLILENGVWVPVGSKISYGVRLGKSGSESAYSNNTLEIYDLKGLTNVQLIIRRATANNQLLVDGQLATFSDVSTRVAQIIANQDRITRQIQELTSKTNKTVALITPTGGDGGVTLEGEARTILGIDLNGNTRLLDLEYLSEHFDFEGGTGWTPVTSVVSDGERRVLRVASFVGGADEPPYTATQLLATPRYIGSSGWVTDISQAVNIRGAQGEGLTSELEAKIESSTFGAILTRDFVSTSLGDPINEALTSTNNTPKFGVTDSLDIDRDNDDDILAGVEPGQYIDIKVGDKRLIAKVAGNEIVDTDTKVRSIWYHTPIFSKGLDQYRQIGAGSGTIQFQEATAGSIAAGAVDTAELADGAVTTAKVADNAITADKLDLPDVNQNIEPYQMERVTLTGYTTIAFGGNSTPGTIRPSSSGGSPNAFFIRLKDADDIASVKAMIKTNTLTKITVGSYTVEGIILSANFFNNAYQLSFSDSSTIGSYTTGSGATVVLSGPSQTHDEVRNDVRASGSTSNFDVVSETGVRTAVDVAGGLDNIYTRAKAIMQGVIANDTAKTLSITTDIRAADNIYAVNINKGGHSGSGTIVWTSAQMSNRSVPSDTDLISYSTSNGRFTLKSGVKAKVFASMSAGENNNNNDIDLGISISNSSGNYVADARSSQYSDNDDYKTVSIISVMHGGDRLVFQSNDSDALHGLQAQIVVEEIQETGAAGTRQSPKFYEQIFTSKTDPYHYPTVPSAGSADTNGDTNLTRRLRLPTTSTTTTNAKMEFTLLEKTPTSGTLNNETFNSELSGRISTRITTGSNANPWVGLTMIHYFDIGGSSVGLPRTQWRRIPHSSSGNIDIDLASFSSHLKLSKFNIAQQYLNNPCTHTEYKLKLWFYGSTGNPVPTNTSQDTNASNYKLQDVTLSDTGHLYASNVTVGGFILSDCEINYYQDREIL